MKNIKIIKLKIYIKMIISYDNITYICSCGTGLTACIVIFALTLIGKIEKCKLYDERNKYRRKR